MGSSAELNGGSSTVVSSAPLGAAGGQSRASVMPCSEMANTCPRKARRVGGCWGAGNSQAGQAPSSGCLPCPRSGRAPSGRWVGPVGDLEKMCMMANVNRLANAVDTPPLTPEGMGSHRSCTPCCESAGREGEKIACCKKTHKKGEKMKISFYASAYVLCLKLGFGVAFQEFFASSVLSTINGGVLHLVVLICGGIGG